jgi:transcriptional regulator GlxA family with amidase domain
VQEHLKRFFDGCVQKKKALGALCTGQKVLLDYGLLQGKQAAAPEEPLYGLRQDTRVHWSTQPVVRDGLIVTGSTAKNVQQFCDVFFQALSGK